jgi:CubicO group peptidase (beta-lactamase class C family)
MWNLQAAEDELPLASPESVGMSSERLERINAYFQRYIDANQISGAVTLVARKGKVVHYEAQGWRSKEENIPMSLDTIFTMASMTKPIVSTALMMLFEEGRFRLDDPIANWLPEYRDHTVRASIDGRTRTVPETRPVTVRHVLTHTSGLTLNPVGRGLTEAQLADATNHGHGFVTLRERIRQAAVIPAAFHPGDHWQYGDSTNYVAALVEEMSGMTINDFLIQRIFAPLGMVDTHYYVPPEKLDRVAARYRPTEDGTISLERAPAVEEPTTYFRGTGGLNSTAADYFRFAQMIANGGELDGVRLLGRMTVDNMISNHIGTGKSVYVRGDGYGFGLGFGVLTNPAQTVDALSIGSYTWGGAYGTLYWADPVEDLIGIMMIQIRPYSHFNIRPMFSNVVTQAVVDSFADQRPKIRGYATPH